MTYHTRDMVTAKPTAEAPSISNPGHVRCGICDGRVDDAHLRVRMRGLQCPTKDTKR